MKIKSIIKMYNMIRRPFAFAFAFIITFIIVSCQIMSVFVFAEAIPVGQPVNPSSLWTVIEGSGPEPDIIKDPYILSVELGSLIGLGTLARETFWQETNAEIAQKIQDGTLNSSDVGTVYYKEVDGVQVPVAIVNTVYGQNCYFITEDLARKIRDENIQQTEAIKNAVLDYWERVVVSDLQPFQDASAVASNWICDLGNTFNDEIVNQVMWNAFGQNLSTPSQQFLSDGIAGSVSFTTQASRDIVYPSNFLDEDFDYVVLKIRDWHVTSGSYQTDSATCIVQYYYDPSWGDFIYKSSVSTIWNPRRGFTVDNINVNPDIRSLSMTYQRFQEIWGSSVALPGDLDVLSIFGNWPLIVHLPDVAPAITPGVRYNVGNVIGAVNDIAALADEAINSNTDPGGDPDYSPDSLPEISPDALPEVLPDAYPSPWPDDFPEEYPDPAPWIDPDSNPYPNPDDDSGDDPGGDDSGGDDSGGDDPGDDDNDWDDEPPQRPRLRVPVLLTLFPFCIPFDIKRSIEWFGNADNSSGLNNNSVSEQYNTGVYNYMSSSEVEEINGNGMEPVFAIPLNIGVSGRPVLQSTVVLDLTEYGIPVLVQYLKTVQIITWIIVLCWGTYKVIY